MKAPTIISSVALLVSAIAIMLATRHPQAPSQSEIDAQVDARLAARELRLVEAYTPRFRVMFADMNEPKIGENWSPRTLEELFEPLTRVLTDIGVTTPSNTDEPSTNTEGCGVDGDKPPN
jgi:hypothetical protein